MTQSEEEYWELKKENEKGMAEIKKRLEETALLAQKNHEDIQELKEQVKITTANVNSLSSKVDSLSSNMHSLGFSIGAATETTFYNSLEKSMKINEIVFYDIYKGMKSKNEKGVVQVEIDILMVNKKYVALIETKHTARLEDLDKLINNTIPKFRMYFPLYNDFTILPYLGAMNFAEKVEETAREKKIGILKFSGDVLEVL